MPRIDNESLDCVVYLYSSTNDASQDIDPLGTGFIVGYPSSDPRRAGYHHCYIVTNLHVLKDAPVARIKHLDGRISTLGCDITDWELNEAADIGIIPIDANVDDLHASYIRPGFFLSVERLISEDIGLGDDVFMVGLLVDHPEDLPNKYPYARFGHVSKMPLFKEPYQRKYGFRIDMRSRVGFSGSPVFIYRNPFSNLKMRINEERNDERSFFFLLGIHWGGDPEIWELDGEPVESRGMSGMTAVTPAWEILKVLEREAFVKQRLQYEKAIKLDGIQEE